MNDNNKQMNKTHMLGVKSNLRQVNLGKFYHNNQKITLSVITLSGFHCLKIKSFQTAET